jgi:hypothetical protein
MGNETGEQAPDAVVVAPEDATEPTAPADEPKTGWSAIPLWGRVAIIVGPIIVIGVVVAILLSTLAQQQDPFAQALDDCGLRAGGDAQLMDDGNSLLLDMAGEESGGLETASMACVLVALDVPDATISRMDSTRALDGRQSDQFGDISVEWTYHPDDGLDVLFTRE